MKGVKGKLMKKIKSMKPIDYLKQDRVFHLTGADGVVKGTFPMNTRLKVQDTKLNWKEADENVKKSCFDDEETRDAIDVKQLIRDFEEEDLESDNEIDSNKENIGPFVKGKESPLRVKESLENSRTKESSSFKQAPLSDIDILSFRRPDLNSSSLFDPNLLAAFEQAVKEHFRMREEERQIRVERQNLERTKQEAERQARIEQETVERRRAINEQENNFVDCREEHPLKTPGMEDDDLLLSMEARCPPGGNESVIFYTTTLGGIRKTLEDCNRIRFLLESFRVVFMERDVSMHMEYKEELRRVLDGKAVPPKLFIKGRYIGGAEEVLMLHEQGKFRPLFEEGNLWFSLDVRDQ
ncbi:hypothetical protein K2173_025176 [Erythroxylum novogranatense]|uniref:Glutaredoxin domain-containing protein n=1 Tax=Erythroxylum novogranatense TaxID=1862640 RepID=A0AAV8SWI5_9ROSI|nr:hypothetical protein K2173_025176 [Erythroxylum novogranatense]